MNAVQPPQNHEDVSCGSAPALTANDRSAKIALADLCDGLLEPQPCATGWQSVRSVDMPTGCADLLVHGDHMTTRLEAHYGQPVELRVLEHRLDGELYRRMILLTLAGSAKVVELGLVRMDLAVVPVAVRAAILAQRSPLGEILIEHHVLRRIVPRSFLRLSNTSPLIRGFGQTIPGDLYGRLATIYCSDQPAIELLEIVTAVGRPDGNT